MDGLRILASYTSRSLTHIRSSTMQAINFDLSWIREKPLYSFRKLTEMNSWIVGCDADIGGKSSAYWGQTQDNTALFWGTLSTALPPASTNVVRSGYAGIRSTMLPFTMLHYPRHDVSKFRYLAIRAKGDGRMWFVNVQCDGVFDHTLYQHRLDFKKTGEWEVVLIPFRDFILTTGGTVQKIQIPLDTMKVRTIGFSVLRQDGDFELELDWIKAYNTPATFGDMDILNDGEYVDEWGRLRRFDEGGSKERLRDMNPDVVDWENVVRSRPDKQEQTLKESEKDDVTEPGQDQTEETGQPSKEK